MRQVRPYVASLEEGVLRVLYEGPATPSECAAGLLHHAYGISQRYTLTATGSERLASLVEVA